MSSYDEVMNFLSNRADCELVVAFGSTLSDEGQELFMASVTVDGNNYGVISRDGILTALEKSAQLSIVGTETSSIQVLRTALEERGFDQAVALLERGI